MPIAEMYPVLLPVWKRCEETHAALLDCLERFPDDHFAWRSAPRARTAAEIVAHIARAECLYAQVLDPQAPAPPPLAYPGTEEAGAPGALVPVDRDSALRAAALAFEYAAEVVGRATQADLERVAAEDWNPLGPDVEGPLDGLWFVEQMNRHKAYHLGQLWYLLSMLEE